MEVFHLKRFILGKESRRNMAVEGNVKLGPFRISEGGKGKQER